MDYAIDIGVTNGFIQEGGTAKESLYLNSRRKEFDMNKCRYSAKCGGCVHMGKNTARALNINRK